MHKIIFIFITFEGGSYERVIRYINLRYLVYFAVSKLNMNALPSPLLSSSANKVKSNSRLTIGIDLANLPSGPSLLPPPIVPTPVCSVAKSIESQQCNPPPNQFPSIPPSMMGPPLAQFSNIVGFFLVFCCVCFFSYLIALLF